MHKILDVIPKVSAIESFDKEHSLQTTLLNEGWRETFIRGYSRWC